MEMEKAEKAIDGKGKVVLVRVGLRNTIETIIDARNGKIVEIVRSSNSIVAEEKVVKENCKVSRLLDNLYMYVINKGYKIEKVVV